ncbi:response regulator [Cohnella sp. JJ-181]|uniref:response regulator n=1 Tax=Cohnella rhizoplanae TaxID=2974897 RepID=UPI0022FF6CCE|nr:response regulator [Cohnella sp. JJ-181]CAI6084076.1 HTH-type transcriptional activator RhaR [Cohnella sp. JJ-181]
MYRLLIVDDEPSIADGLYNLFRSADELSLEVYKAYDGLEALQLAGRLRVDVLLSDIEMPGLNGIELQRELCRIWPKCRTIFLSGYNYFHYIQDSMRGGALDYVLKTEGDEAIVEVVAKAIRHITEQSQYEALIRDAKDQLTVAMPMLRKEYIAELLNGEATTAASRRSQLSALDIPLEAERPVMLAAARIDAWRTEMAPKDRALFHYAMNNIFEEYFAHSYRIFHIAYASDRLLWLMQPAREDPEDPEQANRYMTEMIESVQSACKTYLKLPCSFIVGGRPYEWDELSAAVERFSLLFGRGLGQGPEMILSDRRSSGEERQDRQERSAVQKLKLLAQCLDQKQPQKFYRLYDEIMSPLAERPELQAGVALEAYHSLASLFLSHLNRNELFQRFSERPGVGRLLSYEAHDSFAGMAKYFRSLAESLFAESEDETRTVSNDVVERVRAYIGTHLDGDVSLTRLAESVYLTPFYLSRLYKQQTGQSLTDYIIDIKLKTAMDLLTGTQAKIQEVGAAIGYDTPSYFARFFKKYTQMTPQQYRDLHRKP